MTRQLALTTNQLNFGVLIANDAGPLFVPLRLVAALVGAFLLFVVLRLGLDTAQAVGLLWRLVRANVEYHGAILLLGARVLFTPWQVAL